MVMTEAFWRSLSIAAAARRGSAKMAWISGIARFDVTIVEARS
jgi:hypothetical protein